MQHLLSSQERNNSPSYFTIAQIKNDGTTLPLLHTSSWRGKFIPFAPFYEAVSSMSDECDEWERIWKEAGVA
jgi:hypothetical protein